jgi:hypothetical protein
MCSAVDMCRAGLRGRISRCLTMERIRVRGKKEGQGQKNVPIPETGGWLRTPPGWGRRTGGPGQPAAVSVRTAEREAIGAKTDGSKEVAG